MNTIFMKLLKSKIEKFLSDYINLSRDVFVDKEGKLIHPGEFGTYRENIIKNFIEPFLPDRLAIGTGFIISSKDKISSQCDLIIYDKSNTPVIENEEQRFFPIECVAGVIEVKSRLSKTQFKDALIKLTNIKKIRFDISSPAYLHRKMDNKLPFNPEYFPLDQIATLLICESIDMDFEEGLEDFFNDVYDGIDKSLFHNMILSLDNGCFLYNDPYNVLMYFPYYSNYESSFKNCLVMPSEYGYDKEHILTFVNYFFMLIPSISIMFFEITNYLGATRATRKLF